MRIGERKFWLFFSLGDLFHLNLSFFLAYFVKFESFHPTEKYIFLLLILNMSWLMLTSFFKLTDFKRVSNIEDIVSCLFKAFFTLVLFVTAILFLLKANTFSRQQLLYSFVIGFFFILCWRLFAIFLIKKYRKTGYNTKNVVVVGSGKRAMHLHNFFNTNSPHGYNLLAIFYDKPVSLQFNCPLVDFEELERYCIENRVEEIYYTVSVDNEKKTENLMSFCDNNLIRFRIIPDFKSFKSRKININFYSDIPIITLREEPLQDEVNRLLKRAFDVVFSLFVIVFFYTWMFPLLIAIIKLTDKGPIFFKQLRSGLDNDHFYCYKFRTMQVNEVSDTKQAEKNDSRITKIGSFLRKNSLDEFPQFINVLKGEMSVVGPRPHMIKHTQEYSKLIDSYMVRQLVKPGITGAAQVNGYRGQTKHVEDMEGRVNYDVWYIENWSLLLDVKLIFKTINNLFKVDVNAQ
jgi:putative colanic acid biosysnthesis UDP-glucose lipid carrier transferase